MPVSSKECLQCGGQIKTTTSPRSKTQIKYCVIPDLAKCPRLAGSRIKPPLTGKKRVFFLGKA